jgi:hypothetical protein
MTPTAAETSREQLDMVPGSWPPLLCPASHEPDEALDGSLA